MYRSFRVALVGVVFAPLAVQAQSAGCNFVQTQDACEKAKDLYSYMLPQLGLALAGGNPLLGTKGVIGKLGHFSLGVRATLAKGQLPQFDDVDVSTTGVVASNIPVKEQWIPGPALDAAIGIYHGFPVGVTRVGALDALVSAMYIPKIGDENSSGEDDIKIESSTKFGFGVRVGIIEEAVVIPGISFAYLQRGLPKVTLNTDANTSGADFGVKDLEVNVNTWRVIATKNFLLFQLSGGFGGDSYKSDGAVTASAGGQSEQVSLKRDLSRTSWFVDFALNLGPIKLAAEYGQGGTSTVSTFNHFDPPAGDKLKFYSAGLRIGF